MVERLWIRGLLLIPLFAVVHCVGNDLDLRIIIANKTDDQFLFTITNSSTQNEESTQLIGSREIIDFVLKWGYYRLSFRNTVHNKTVAVERSTLTNVSNSCVAITLTPGLYPGEPYVGFSALCEVPDLSKKS